MCVHICARMCVCGVHMHAHISMGFSVRKVGTGDNNIEIQI